MVNETCVDAVLYYQDICPSQHTQPAFAQISEPDLFPRTSDENCLTKLTFDLEQE